MKYLSTINIKGTHILIVIGVKVYVTIIVKGFVLAKPIHLNIIITYYYLCIFVSCAACLYKWAVNCSVFLDWQWYNVY